MNHSLSSLHENLYDISILATGKKKYGAHTPRRVGSVLSLSTLNEVKRPGDYFTQRMSNSLLNLPPITRVDGGASAHRPISGDLILSLQLSVSDEASLLASSHFEPDSRLSSMTTNLISDVPIEKKFNQSLDSVNEPSDLTEVNASLATITLRSPELRVPLRTQSTSSLSPRVPSSSLPPAPSPRANSTSSLIRTKSRYLNAKETKERKELRKKMYDENDDDDDILSNDLDLVFNVPVIKNHALMYMSHTDLITDNTDKYKVRRNVSPFPLPGKLGHSTSSLAISPASESSLRNDSILEEDEHPAEESSISLDDTQITESISNFYSERLMSYSKLAKMNREHHMMYKLPNFVRSQSLVDELSLISPEKLNYIDQTRPINLPPKSQNDKAKHNKEFHKVLTSLEQNTKVSNESRRKSTEQHLAHQASWQRLMALEEKEFAKKIVYDKKNIRKLVWESAIPEKLRYQFFSQVLPLQSTYDSALAKFNGLSSQMRVSKDAEFDATINAVMGRPLYQSITAEMGDSFSPASFKADFRFLLYMRSFSESGLKKHDELFVIPVVLLLFRGEPVERVYAIVELLSTHVFHSDFLGALNKSLATWSTTPLKILSKFTPSEFDHLSSNTLFELVVQLNDRLPLSLSAPSTPCVGQGGFSFQLPEKSPNTTVDDLISSSSSATASLMGKLLLTLAIYASSPKTAVKNNVKVVESFLAVVFKYYHLNWNDYGTLIKENKSIRLNNSHDSVANVESFMDKWREAFRSL